MGAGMNEKQVGGMLARLSPLTQYLPHEYAIVVSSERQAVGTADIKGEELAYLRGGPMPTSTTIGARPASATAADGCCWGRNKWRMLRAKRLERAPGRLRHSRRLHHRCDGGPLVSRWDASSSLRRRHCAARFATFRPTPTTVGNRTFAEWWADFDVTAGGEEAMAAQIGDGVFVAGFEALEKKLACQGGAAHRSRQAPQL
jgi:hypothetical protein